MHRCAVQVVVVVDVAIGAGPRRNRVRPGQREAGLRVIELAIRPLDGVVALFASRREARMRHRAVGVLVVGLVARNASGDRDVVVVVDVTVGASARRNRMRSRQRPASLRVIEFAIRPLDGVVALLAGCRESRMWHRTVRILEIVLVARNASRDRDVVVVVDVAIGASPRRNRVRASQREAGLRWSNLPSVHWMVSWHCLASRREVRCMWHRTFGVLDSPSGGT